MLWSCLLHIYQPPWQKKEILERVVKESYLPFLRILEKNKKAKITLNICGSLTELLIKNGFYKIIQKIKKLAKRGQIEFVDSAAYHPILPLLPQAEIIRQVKLNKKINKKNFGKIYQTQGFFMPEMSYDRKTAEIIESFGYQWLILDEIAYQGQLGRVSFDKYYQLKKSKLKIIFRNRGLSDIFHAGWLTSEKRFQLALNNDQRSGNFLVTAFDGENLGHHRPGSEKIFSQLIKKNKTLTISDFFENYRQNKLIKPEIIEPITSSWSSREVDIQKKIAYPLWFHPENIIHQKQWALTNFVIKTVEAGKKDEGYKKARNLLDKALSSCQYWWASAAPWWSKEIIDQGAKSFLDVLACLKNLDKRIKQRAEKIKKEITLTAQKWEKQGHIKKIKKTYLAGEPLIYFGGKKIK